jgi:hydrogenase-4 component B
MGWTVLAFGALSAFFGVMYTSTQRDLKRLLGYSSTENVGIAAMGFGVGYLGWTWDLPTLSACGFAAGLLHLFNHALFKCLLFYAAGSVYRAAHTVDIERLGGLAKKIPATALLFLTGALAISALPPLNGFASELLLYSGLLSGSAPSSQGNIVLVTAAAALAFVGAVSALSMTRAFGLTFLGTAREAREIGPEAPPTMLGTMLLQTAGVVALGIAPELGLLLTRSALKLFPVAAGVVDDVLVPLGPAILGSRLLALALGVAIVVGWRRGAQARRSVTWGCGYTAGSPRMQYTGTGFTEKFAHVFASILPSVRREQLPVELLPRAAGHLATHHPDAVEVRMFEVLGQGEDYVMQASERIPEQPRFAFAAGLLALVIIGALLLGGSQ